MVLLTISAVMFQCMCDECLEVVFCVCHGVPLSFRLVSLPPRIGDLQQLKELHVRHNKLKCLPTSIQELHLYTFTGVAF